MSPGLGENGSNGEYIPLQMGLKCSILLERDCCQITAGSCVGQGFAGGSDSEAGFSHPTPHQHSLWALWPKDVTAREAGKEGISKRQRISVGERGAQ